MPGPAAKHPVASHQPHASFWMHERHLCADMCVDVYADTCVDVCVDMCVDVCVGMRVDVCADMCGHAYRHAYLRCAAQRRNPWRTHSSATRTRPAHMSTRMPAHVYS